ncbi:MAG: hypothetical protein H0U24_03710 [Thermoleophilaceae bacterium]|nr:hypothetical protein [Thermoleophilaceae bacterium]
MHLKGLFRLQNGRKLEDRFRSLYAAVKIVPGPTPLPELEVTESLHGQNDSTCCPSGERVTRYRWNGSRIAYVPDSKRVNFFD